jgi:mono/diheme cytochrome c family protein
MLIPAVHQILAERLRYNLLNESFLNEATLVFRFVTSFSLFVLPVFAFAEEPSAERGKKALEGTAFIKAFWPKPAYDNAWKVWGLKEKPKEYEAAVRERYGLHPAPFPNDGYPMGLRKADMLLGKGVGIDCMTCHGGSIFGKSYVGLGNTSLDIHALFEELAAASSTPAKLPFAFSQVRGTSEAGAFAVYLLGMRKPDLSISTEIKDLGLQDNACEDVPAWWLLKKKKTMYHVGATDARSVRSLMQFMMHPLTMPSEFADAEATFRDIQAYLLSLEPPKYPFPVDVRKVEQGRAVFEKSCSTCHGTYGENGTYPNKVIALGEIGTDRTRYDAIGLKFGEAYNASWFAQEKPAKPVKATKGYQAPPLDGVWATAPYFHNGSVPTLTGVLNSKARPKVYTRSFQTDEASYDSVNVGWKVKECNPPDPRAGGLERRKVYDTTQPGRGNGGHTYGDELNDEERAAVIEYLKTL